MDYPGLDLSKMTKEEILEKMRKCQNMIMNSQHNHSLNQSIRGMYEAYEYEYQQRIIQDRREENEKKNPAGVIEIGSIEDISTKNQSE
jgi:hypothetical protein